jgi:tetratricopeptide (TPR) repeat protein
MVLAPYNDPIPLTRGWCIWELYCTISSPGCEFDVAMPKQIEENFVKDIDADPTECINNMLATISCEHSECFKPEDKEQIHHAIRTTIGFAEMDKTIFEVMRTWVIEKYARALERRNIHEKRLILFEPFLTAVSEGRDLPMTTPRENENSSETVTDDNGNSTEVISQLRTYLKTHEVERRKNIGEAQLSAVLSLRSLAKLYFDQGNYDNAYPLYQECLETITILFGEDHPDTLSVMEELTVVFQSKGDYDTALSVLLDCLEKRRRVSEDNDHSTLNKLVIFYMENGEFDKAFPLCMESFEKEKKLFGENHPSTLQSVNNLAACYCSKHEYG